MEISFQTVRAFFSGDIVPSGFSPLAIRAKASAIFQRSYHISLSWDPRRLHHLPKVHSIQLTLAYAGTTSTDIMGEEIRVMDVTQVSFLSSLLPLHQLESATPETKHIVLAAYTLAHAATINLYRRFAKNDGVSYDKCLQAARSMVGVCQAVDAHDYACLDPIVGVSWFFRGRLFIANGNPLALLEYGCRPAHSRTRSLERVVE